MYKINSVYLEINFQWIYRMKIITHKELRDNTKMYLDLAKTEDIIIRRGETETFYLTSERFLEPDEDLERAITMDELYERVKLDIHKMFEKPKMKK